MYTLGTRRSSASGTLDETVWLKSCGVRTSGTAGAPTGGTGVGPGAVAVRAGAARAGAAARAGVARRRSPPSSVLRGRGLRTLDSGVAVTLTSGRAISGVAVSADAGTGDARTPTANKG